MAKPAARPDGVFFIADSSTLAVDIQRLLTNGPHRCNIMMVANGDQALAILRQESRAKPQTSTPHVFLIYGGLRDGRAAGLLEVIRRDATFAAIPMVLLVGPKDEADAVSSLVHGEPFSLDRLTPLLEKNGFWWVIAKLG